MSKRPRVAIVYPVLNEYAFPVLRLIADTCDFDLTVFFARRALVGRPRRPENADLGFPHIFLPDAGRVRIRRNVHTIDLNPTLPLELERRGVDLVVVSGYVQPTALLGIVWAKARRRRYGVLSESHGLRVRGSFRQALRRTLVGPLVERADVLFPTGRLAAAELLKLGVAADRLFLFPHVPDPSVFRADDRVADGAALRSRLAVPPEARVIAFVGRLVQSKGVETLLEAHRIVREHCDATLVMAGEGPLRESLTAAAPDGVVFLGFQTPEATASVLRGCDLIVFPSLDEPWGTAALEAAACGCPFVATDRVAAAVELVEEFGAGRLVPAGDVAALAAAVTELLSSPDDLAELSVRGVHAASKYTPQAAARSFVEGVQRALSRGRRS